jgi:ArsR family transcriptional regulator
MKLDRIFKLVGDRTKLRVLMLLDKGELCVCQVMAVLGVSQSLISKNMAKLRDGGFLEERKEGKLVFYKISSELPKELNDTMDLLRKHMKNDNDIIRDKAALKECLEFQKKKGTCDMKTFQEYMTLKKGRK